MSFIFATLISQYFFRPVKRILFLAVLCCWNLTRTLHEDEINLHSYSQTVQKAHGIK
jgi:hypothetical protein